MKCECNEQEFGLYRKYCIIIHETFGITRDTFNALRSELLSRINNNIIVGTYNLKNPIGNGGFIIVDKTERSIIVTGNGFRGDKQGEGGRGYQKAIDFIASLGGIISFDIDHKFDSAEYYKDKEKYSYKFLKQIIDEKHVLTYNHFNILKMTKKIEKDIYTDCN